MTSPDPGYEKKNRNEKGGTGACVRLLAFTMQGLWFAVRGPLGPRPTVPLLDNLFVVVVPVPMHSLLMLDLGFALCESDYSRTTLRILSGSLCTDLFQVSILFSDLKGCTNQRGVSPLFVVSLSFVLVLAVLAMQSYYVGLLPVCLGPRWRLPRYRGWSLLGAW